MRTLLIILALASLGRIAAAEEPRALVQRMFTAERGTAGQNAASAAYLDLQKAVPNDPRVDYACALALLRQQRVPQAHSYLDRYLKAVPADRQARQLKIYLHLQAREIEAAMAGCQQIAEQLPKVASNDPEWAESARFLGVVVGYLEQAFVETSGKAEARREQKKQLLAAIPPRWLESFDEGRLQVTSRLAELQSLQIGKQDKAHAEREQKKEFVEATIDQRQSEIAYNDQQLQSSAESVRDAQRQLTVIQGQLNSLLADRSVLAAQLVVAQTRFVEMQQQLTGNTGNVPNPRQNISPADAAIFNNLGLAMATLSKQLFDLDRRITTLRTQAAGLMAQARQSSQIAAASQDAIAEAQIRTRSLEKQAQRLEQTKPPAAPRRTSQMRLLTTYLPSPLESEQARVLQWFN